MLDNWGFENDAYSHALFYAGVNVTRWHLGFPPRAVTIYADGTAELSPNTAQEIPRYDRRFPLPADVQPHQVISLHIRENGQEYYLRVPTPAERVLMVLVGRLVEGLLLIPPDVLAWPASVLAPLWEDLTLEYCLTAFDVPLTPEGALLHCFEQAKFVYGEYSDLILELANALAEHHIMSSDDVLELCTEWVEEVGQED